MKYWSLSILAVLGTIAVLVFFTWQWFCSIAITRQTQLFVGMEAFGILHVAEQHDAVYFTKVTDSHFYLRVLPEYQSGRPWMSQSAWSLAIPVWPLPPLVFGVWRVATKGRRRRRLARERGQCPVCEYSNVGLATGSACPECGGLVAIHEPEVR